MNVWQSNIELTDLVKSEPPEKRVRKDSGSEDDVPKETKDDTKEDKDDTNEEKQGLSIVGLFDSVSQS